MKRHIKTFEIGYSIYNWSLKPYKQVEYINSVYTVTCGFLFVKTVSTYY